MYAVEWTQLPKFVFFGSYSAQTVRSLPKLAHKRHILWMLTSPRNDSRCLRLCCLSCSLITNTPSKVSIVAVLGICRTPRAEINPLWRNSEMFHWYTHVDTDSCVLSQKWSKLVQDKWPKVHFVLVTKTKHVLASLDATPGAISPQFLCECAP